MGETMSSRLQYAELRVDAMEHALKVHLEADGGCPDALPAPTFKDPMPNPCVWGSQTGRTSSSTSSRLSIKVRVPASAVEEPERLEEATAESQQLPRLEVTTLKSPELSEEICFCEPFHAEENEVSSGIAKSSSTSTVASEAVESKQRDCLKAIREHIRETVCEMASLKEQSASASFAPRAASLGFSAGKSIASSRARSAPVRNDLSRGADACARRTSPQVLVREDLSSLSDLWDLGETTDDELRNVDHEVLLDLDRLGVRCQDVDARHMLTIVDLGSNLKDDASQDVWEWDLDTLETSAFNEVRAGVEACSWA